MPLDIEAQQPTDPGEPALSQDLVERRVVRSEQRVGHGQLGLARHDVAQWGRHRAGARFLARVQDETQVGMMVVVVAHHHPDLAGD